MQRRREAQAIAVSGGKIIAVGSNADIQKLKGPKTQVVDLGGHFAMPGFNDAHVHLGSGGFEKLNVDLVGAKSLADMKERIAARVKTAAPGEWITGRGWDHTLWAVQETPTRADIDAVTGDHPAIFNRVDGHIAIANSAALKAAGITSTSADPHGGKIDKDEKGEPTGILRETAMGLVGRKDSRADTGATQKGRRAGSAGRRSTWHHLCPGQFRLGRFPHLRAIGKRRQADPANR